jgi:choline dehydrogenase-like flavoprotein
VTFGLQRAVSIAPPVYVTRAPYQQWAPLRGVAGVLWSSTPLRLRSLLSLRPDKADELGFSLFGTLPPDERNGVSLAAGPRDADGVAALELRLRFDEETEPSLVRGRDRLLEILDAAGLRPSLKTWLIEKPGTSVHFGGTVRMHASPRFGMLDGHNRLHAAPEVLVVDASCFTTGPEKNPTLTAMALASRACRKLAADLRS